MYHSTCMQSLVSFLQEATPPYMDIPQTDSEVLYVYERIWKHVFYVFCRLITNKESEVRFYIQNFYKCIVLPTLYPNCKILRCIIAVSSRPLKEGRISRRNTQFRLSSQTEHSTQLSHTAYR